MQHPPTFSASESDQNPRQIFVSLGETPADAVAGIDICESVQSISERAGTSLSGPLEGLLVEPGEALGQLSIPAGRKAGKDSALRAVGDSTR
jgi:hypothetical protein